MAVLRAACQALRSCASQGRMDVALGPSRRGTTPSMPVRQDSGPSRGVHQRVRGRPSPLLDVQEPVSVLTQISSSTRVPSGHVREQHTSEAGREAADVMLLLSCICQQASLNLSIVPALRRSDITCRPYTHSVTVSIPLLLSLGSRLGPSHPVPGHRVFSVSPV